MFDQSGSNVTLNSNAITIPYQHRSSSPFDLIGWTPALSGEPGLATVAFAHRPDSECLTPSSNPGSNVIPATSRQLLSSVRPVIGVVGGWAFVVLISEFGIKNIGYNQPDSLIWWVGTLVSVSATLVALAAILLFVLAKGIALGREGLGPDKTS